ncbi:MAG: hypothetical protein AAGG48_24620 [Planctomycetota bacterium]
MSLVSHLPRFRQARASLSELARREDWTRSEIDDWQLGKINRLWDSARINVPYYRKITTERGLPDRFDSMAHFVQSMPTLDKQCVRSNPLDFLSQQNNVVGSWHRTGGSSGIPMRVFWAKAAHLETLRTKYRLLQAWGIDLFDRSAFLWGHGGSIAPGLAGLKQRIRRPVEDYLRNRLRRSAYRLGENDLTEHLSRLKRFRPISLYGYSSAVGLLADHAKRHQWQLSSLKLVILSGEPAHRELVERVSTGLQCDVAIEYGSVECGVMATGDREGNLRVREDAVHLETVPNENGLYDVVVTVLNNPTFPLIRYRIEDLTSEPIRKGSDGFATLTTVCGRQNDALIAQSGRQVHSIAVKHVLEHYSQIRRFCAHQTELGDLRVTVETDTPDAVPFGNIQKKLSSMLEGYRVSIATVDQIPGNLAGKHRWVISDMINGKSHARHSGTNA